MVSAQKHAERLSDVNSRLSLQSLEIADQAEELSRQRDEFERLARELSEKQIRLKLLESAVVHARDAVIVLEGTPQPDRGRGVLYVNEAFTRMTGYAADEVLIPIDPCVAALAGVRALEDLVRDVGGFRCELTDAGPLAIAGVLITRADRTLVARQVEAEVRAYFGELVFERPVPLSDQPIRSPARAPVLEKITPRDFPLKTVVLPASAPLSSLNGAPTAKSSQLSPLALPTRAKARPNWSPARSPASVAIFAYEPPA